MENVNKEWVFIVNPIAGNGFGKTIVPKLKEMILAGGVVKQCPAWLSLDKEAVKIKVLREPSRSEVSVLVEEGHIVNLYSR